jgi:hypothetical protein
MSLAPFFKRFAKILSRDDMLKLKALAPFNMRFRRKASRCDHILFATQKHHNKLFGFVERLVCCVAVSNYRSGDENR